MRIRSLALATKKSMLIGVAQGGYVEIIDHGLQNELAVAGIVAMLVVGFALLSVLAAAVRNARAERGEGFLALGTMHANENRALQGDAELLAGDRVRTGSVREERARARIREAFKHRLRERPALQDNLLFLSRWASSPLKVGAVAPSSHSLGQAMAAELPAQYGICVELGGGTGSLTRALLAAGMPPEALIVVERDPRLAAYLRRRFTGVRVVLGDAARLTEILRAEGIEHVDAIVSSLPLRLLPRNVREGIFAEGFRALSDDGVFLQYTYGLLPPVRAKMAGELLVRGEMRRRVWNNIPPANVWRYRRLGS